MNEVSDKLHRIRHSLARVLAQAVQFSRFVWRHSHDSHTGDAHWGDCASTPGRKTAEIRSCPTDMDAIAGAVIGGLATASRGACCVLKEAWMRMHSYCLARGSSAGDQSRLWRSTLESVHCVGAASGLGAAIRAASTCWVSRATWASRVVGHP